MGRRSWSTTATSAVVLMLLVLQVESADITVEPGGETIQVSSHTGWILLLWGVQPKRLYFGSESLALFVCRPRAHLSDKEQSIFYYDL